MSRVGLRTALAVVAHYPDAVRAVADDDWERNPDASDRVELMRLYLRHVAEQTALVEDWFQHGIEEAVSSSLLAAAERECDQLLATPRRAVLSLGAVDNFETLISDLTDLLFGNLGAALPPLPSELAGTKFGMVRLPRTEGSSALWWPLVLGHELAHLAFLEHNLLDEFNLADRLDSAALSGLTGPDFSPLLHPVPAFAVLQVGERWVEELVCDAYAIRRFGPAAVAALGTFLEMVGATDHVSWHPPGWFRLRLAVHWLGTVTSPRLQKVVSPWQELAASPSPAFPDWAVYLMELLEQNADDIQALVAGWPEAFDHKARISAIEWVADQLSAGIAPAEFLAIRPPDGSVLNEADAINAGWIVRVEEAEVPVDRLVNKTVESVDFIRRWTQRGGEVETLGTAAPTATGTGAALSGEAIAARLDSIGPDRLVITPRLPGSLGGAGVDIRLGRHFIVFLRSGIAQFDPLETEFDSRAMQSPVETGWGETFILHPNELVLATTLEYLVVPADLACQVITRSSYGRLGLLTATAVLVHPHFRGCLTLELVNLGEVPIALTPGQRIAQLSFHPVEPPAPEPTTKYDCPTGPEFSKVGTDRDAAVLRAMRPFD